MKVDVVRAVAVAMIVALRALAACDEQATNPPEAGTPDATIPDGAKMDAPADGTGSDQDAFDSPADSPDACMFVDATSDPKNCGRCGHDCLGGACTNGVCQPFDIGPAQSPNGIASDGTNVFWAESNPGAIQRCARTGCGDAGSTMLAPAYGATALAVDNTNVYYTTYVNDGGAVIGSVSKSMPADAGTTLAGSLTYAANIVIDSTYMYVNEYNSQIHRCTIPSCSGFGSIVSVVVEQGLAIDSSNLYWTESYANVIACDKANCQSTRHVVAAGLNGLSSVGVWSTDVFFAPNEGGGAGAGRLLSCPTNGMSCSPKVLATGIDDPSDVVADATGVYVAAQGTTGGNFADGKILQCSAMGCGSTPTVLASSCDHIQHIAIDDKGVYWTEAYGKVRGVAKP